MRIPVIKLEKAVRELAAEHPGAKYEKVGDQCLYASGKAGGEEGCIIGQALLRVGFNRGDLEKMDDAERVGIGGTDIANFLPGRDSRRERFICCVQGHQDRGLSWGEAVKKADKECAS